MASSIPPVDPVSMEVARKDIEEYIRDLEDRNEASRQLQSVAEFGPGDEKGCTWYAALDNCEQIKGYFPVGTPESTFKNLDRIADEIRRIEKAQTPILWRILSNRFFVLGIGVILACYLYLQMVRH